MSQFFQQSLRALTLGLSLFLSTAAWGSEQTPRIGVIDAIQLEKSQQFQAAQARLEKEFKPRQQSLESKQKELQDKHKKFQRDEVTLSDKERIANEREINKLQQDFQRLVEEYEVDHRTRQQEEMISFNKLVDEVVKEVAKKEKYDLVLHGQVALYNTDNVDFTAKVLKELERRVKKG